MATKVVIDMLPQLDEIERRRRRLSLSQKELAKLSGVSQSMIAKIEASKISPSYMKTKAIFDVLEGLERQREVKVREILHSKVVGIQGYEPVSKAVKLMNDAGFSQLPVFDGRRLIGSVSERTVMDRIMEGRNPKELSRLPVEKVMDEAFPCVDEETPVSAISTLLRYGPAVLVTKRGEVTGILTKADMLKMLGS